jgi:hypothetical protein
LNGGDEGGRDEFRRILVAGKLGAGGESYLAIDGLRRDRVAFGARAKKKPGRRAVLGLVRGVT